MRHSVGENRSGQGRKGRKEWRGENGGGNVYEVIAIQVELRRIKYFEIQYQNWIAALIYRIYVRCAHFFKIHFVHGI